MSTADHSGANAPRRLSPSSDSSLYVVLRLDYPCGCKSFHPMRLHDYCAEPALAGLEWLGVYPSEEVACNAAKDAAATAQREMHS